MPYTWESISLEKQNKFCSFLRVARTQVGNSCYIYVVVQFYPWFKFYFPLFQTHYHTLQYPKTKENKI